MTSKNPAHHFNSSYCKFVKCRDYRKNDDGIGLACCQVTGYVPGNMPMCPHDMSLETLAKYSDRRKQLETPEEIKHRKKIDTSEKSIAEFTEETRAEHPDWYWELWKIEPHPASHPEAGTNYEWLWEIFPKEQNAKSYLKTTLRVEGKDSKRKWEIRQRPDNRRPSKIETIVSTLPITGSKKIKNGKRPSIRICPDNCPHKKIVPEKVGKEKNYPQGRCGSTDQKLREMKSCPHALLDEMDDRTRQYLINQIKAALQVQEVPAAAALEIPTGPAAGPEVIQDPICQECKIKHEDPEAKACKWCNEEQEKHGRRAAFSLFNMNVLYCMGCQDAMMDLFPESIDLIFTDPPYVSEQWEEAYNTLADIGKRVLKPSGFLFTYVPQYRLDQVLDIIRARGLKYYWIIPQLNLGKDTGLVHARNAICLHKPIVVFQKPPLKKAPKIFNDVIRSLKQKQYHPWQQSIHDVLGILPRFCSDPETSFGKDIVLDPFAGTGTTLIAAGLLGLNWIGFENNPDTHKIALGRLQQRPITLSSFHTPVKRARKAAI